MSDIFLLYAFTMLGSLEVVFVILYIATIVCSIVGGVWLITARVDCVEDAYFKRNYENARTFMRKCVIWFACLSAFGVIVPGQRDVAIIVGGKIALDAARSDKGQEMSQALYDAILGKLKEAAEPSHKK